MEGQLNIWKLINAIHHIDRLKKKGHVIILIDAKIYLIKYKREVNRLYSTAFLYIYGILEFKMKTMGQGDGSVVKIWVWSPEPKH